MYFYVLKLLLNRIFFLNFSQKMRNAIIICYLRIYVLSTDLKKEKKKIKMCDKKQEYKKR